MSFSYNETRSLAAPLSAPILIDAGETGKWYFPRGTRGNNTGNSYTGKFNVSAVPLSFSQDVTINQYRLVYNNGANAGAFSAVGAGAIMFRGAIYAADVNGIPKTKVGEMGYCTYVPGVDSSSGIVGVASFPAPINLEANKQYFLHFAAVAVTLSAGVPNTILESDTFDLLSHTAYMVGPTDPMASVGMEDSEFSFNPIGVSAYFLQETIDATSGAGNALNSYPANLSALGAGVFLTSNPIVVAVRTED